MTNAWCSFNGLELGQTFFLLLKNNQTLHRRFFLSVSLALGTQSGCKSAADQVFHRWDVISWPLWLHLVSLVSSCICSVRALQLVECRIDLCASHIVEVEAAQHGDSPHQRDLHAEHWFQAHVLAHIPGIPHHGQHGWGKSASKWQGLDSARAQPLQHEGHIFIIFPILCQTRRIHWDTHERNIHKQCPSMSMHIKSLLHPFSASILKLQVSCLCCLAAVCQIKNTFSDELKALCLKPLPPLSSLRMAWIRMKNLQTSESLERHRPSSRGQLQHPRDIPVNAWQHCWT